MRVGNKLETSSRSSWPYAGVLMQQQRNGSRSSLSAPEINGSEDKVGWEEPQEAVVQSLAWNKNICEIRSSSLGLSLETNWVLKIPKGGNCRTSLENVSGALTVLSQVSMKVWEQALDSVWAFLRKPISTEKTTMPLCLPVCLHKVMGRIRLHTVPWCSHTFMPHIPLQNTSLYHQLLCPHKDACQPSSSTKTLRNYTHSHNHTQHLLYHSALSKAQPEWVTVLITYTRAPFPSRWWCPPMFPFLRYWQLNCDNIVAKQHESSKQPTMTDHSNSSQIILKATAPATILSLSSSSTHT